jgi:hypothetical protein
MSIKEIEKADGLMATLASASRSVRRWPVHICEECNGTKMATYEVDNGGNWDRIYEKLKCRSCGGKGTYGGGQPTLSLYFQSMEELDSFKTRLAKMRGISWISEGNTLESTSEPKWEG